MNVYEADGTVAEDAFSVTSTPSIFISSSFFFFTVFTGDFTIVFCDVGLDDDDDDEDGGCEGRWSEEDVFAVGTGLSIRFGVAAFGAVVDVEGVVDDPAGVDGVPLFCAAEDDAEEAFVPDDDGGAGGGGMYGCVASEARSSS
jgi:hypothetical protein